MLRGDTDYESKLLEYVEDGKLNDALQLLDAMPELEANKTNANDETPLMVLLKNQNNYSKKHQKAFALFYDALVLRLINLDKKDHLFMKDKDEKQAFDYAIEIRVVDYLKQMAEKDDALLLRIPDMLKQALTNENYPNLQDIFEKLYIPLEEKINSAMQRVHPNEESFMVQFQKLIDEKIAQPGGGRKVGNEDPAYKAVTVLRAKYKDIFSEEHIPRYMSAYNAIQLATAEKNRMEKNNRDKEVKKERQETEKEEDLHKEIQLGLNLNGKIFNAYTSYMKRNWHADDHRNNFEELYERSSKSDVRYSSLISQLANDYLEQEAKYKDNKKRIGLFSKHNPSDAGFANYLNKNQKGHHYSRSLGLLLRTEMQENPKRVRQILGNKYEELSKTVNEITLNNNNKKDYAAFYNETTDANKDKKNNRRSK